jgi:phospholipase C
MRKLALLAPLLGVLLWIPAMTSAPAAGGVPRPTAIQHIVIQFNENISFDHFLGDYCRRSQRRMACNVDAKTGKPFNPAAPVKVETRGHNAHQRSDQCASAT